MEGGLPMLNCLLQNTLRSLCSSSDSAVSSKWVYAVFWRILPRNYPPPKWDYGGSALDRSKGNKRNWILVWEDGFCDFYECECARTGFGADIFFKMSHEVYNFGEGLVGKVAAENSHKWVFKEATKETDPIFISSWNTSLEPVIQSLTLHYIILYLTYVPDFNMFLFIDKQQPKAWDSHFNSGIQTIALISVREGMIQLGSFNKITEDLNLVISIQRKLSYLQSIPGVFAMQRPYLPIHHPYIIKPNIENHDTAFLLTGAKRLFEEMHEESPIKSINLGWNTPQNGLSTTSMWSLPNMSCSFGALLSKLPSSCHVNVSADQGLVINKKNVAQVVDNEVQVAGKKDIESSCHVEDQEQKSCYINSDRLGFESMRDGESALM